MITDNNRSNIRWRDVFGKFTKFDQNSENTVHFRLRKMIRKSKRATKIVYAVSTARANDWISLSNVAAVLACCVNSSRDLVRWCVHVFVRLPACARGCVCLCACVCASVWFESIHCFSYWIYEQKATTTGGKLNLSLVHTKIIHTERYYLDLYIPGIFNEIYVRTYIFIYFIWVSCHSIAKIRCVHVWCLCARASELMRMPLLRSEIFSSHVTIAGWSLAFSYSACVFHVHGSATHSIFK